MHTFLSPEFLHTDEGKRAQELIAKCVHCGFCNATCPTYQLLGDELDGPRGRIYLMKQVFEGEPVSKITQDHLDRCLTCRACETTCPSGVQYSQLLEIGQAVLERKVPRSAPKRVARWAVREALSEPKRFEPLYQLGQKLRPLLPQSLKDKLPDTAAVTAEQLLWPVAKRKRQMLVLQGCVQPTLAPEINAAAARVLDRFGIQLVQVDNAGCCGAIKHHNGDTPGALEQARRNIDAWWPFIDSGAVEAVVMTASGCGAEVQDYGRLLADDPHYAEKAQHVAEACRDISAVVAREIERLGKDFEVKKQKQLVAVQEPCTFQHALRVKTPLATLLQRFGFEVCLPQDPHLCCGSAGTYALFQPKIARQLRRNKLQALTVDQPDLIATANIGCQTHLGQSSSIPVRHWIQLADQVLGDPLQG